MRKSHLATGLFAVLLTGALVQPTTAEPITFVYEGPIESVQGGAAFEAFLGETFKVQYTFESTWPDGWPENPEVGDYIGAISSLIVSIGPNTYVSSEIISFAAYDNFDRVGAGPEDSYQVATNEMIGPDIDGLPQSQFLLFLSDATATAFTSDALPLNPPNLDDFEELSFLFINFFDSTGFGVLETSNFTGRIIPTVQEVVIDIKPNSDPNSINLDAAGVIPVAILSSSTFDATTVDPATVFVSGAAVKLAGTSLMCHEEFVNGDEFVDLICQVETADFMIEPGQATATLTAKTVGGVTIEGSGSIEIVP